MLARSCFMHALWYSALLAHPWEWDAPSLGFLVVSIPLVLHATLTPGWAPARTEEPREGKHMPQAQTHPPAKCCSGAVHSQIPGSPVPQGSVQGGAHVGHAVLQSRQQDPEIWRWHLSAGPGCRTPWGCDGEHSWLEWAARMPCSFAGVFAPCERRQGIRQEQRGNAGKKARRAGR